MQPPPHERELIESAQKGDKAAVGALYEAYADGIFQYISYRVETDEVAEDITSEVFLRMVRGLPKYEYTGAPLSAWLYRIASNRVTDHYRKSGRTVDTPDLEDMRSELDSPIDLITQEEERFRLRAALSALSEDYQNVLILRFMKELSHANVGEIIGKSEANVRVIQHRALKALALELEKLDMQKGDE